MFTIHDLARARWVLNKSIILVRSYLFEYPMPNIAYTNKQISIRNYIILNIVLGYKLHTNTSFQKHTSGRALFLCPNHQKT